ncbi:MAG: Gmad2 immunoglobulin-like domain-containing protein [Coriobacteriia bacterium]|nr:Gmad2 immunoglobulin-like domain-containing protein [Coriobacteriia bacterium]
MKMMHASRGRAIGILSILLLLVFLVMALPGCAREVKPQQPEEPDHLPTATPEPAPSEGTITPMLYLVRGEKLGVATREMPSTAGVARAALTALLAGPTDRDVEAGLSTEIPAGTTLNDVAISDGVATVDLSPEFEGGGGSLSMQLRVAQVVYTLTALPTVNSVAFRIDGKLVEAIGGEGVIVSPPVDRAVFADNTLPAILVETPAPWQKVASPLRVAGMSNTFEAAFSYEIVDQAGLIVAEGSGMATAGTGTWGTFDVTVPFEVTRKGAGSLVVFELSAKDGSRINLVEIPLEFEK